jgi:hypothetical protein
VPQPLAWALGGQMAEIAKSTVCLRIYSDDLIPEEITKSLECEPTFTQFKGQELLGPQSGRKRIAMTGMWRLGTDKRTPEDINSQIYELLNQVSSNLEVWESINKHYQVDLFCGLFMNLENEGFDLTPQTMKLLSERGITIGFDVYGPDDDS